MLSFKHAEQTDVELIFKRIKGIGFGQILITPLLYEMLHFMDIMKFIPYLSLNYLIIWRIIEPKCFKEGQIQCPPQCDDIVRSRCRIIWPIREVWELGDYKFTE